MIRSRTIPWPRRRRWRTAHSCRNETEPVVASLIHPGALATGVDRASRPEQRFGHLKPLSLPNVCLCAMLSSREEIMAAAIEMPKKSSTSTRGFASMDREKQLAIARKGGESVPNEKRSFSQNPRLAAEAGRKGGQSVNPAKRSFSRNHALASEAGRKGGHASHSGPKKPAA
jgi:general stress protein YciG